VKTLYFDCFSGISGDMAVAALLDLGVPGEVVRQALIGLPLDGAEVSWGKAAKNGIQATRFTVSEPMSGHGHEHGHTHTHEHGHESGHEHAHGHTHTHAHEHGHEHGHTHEPMSGHGTAGHASPPHRTLTDIEAILGAAGLPPDAAATARRIFRLIAEAEGTIHGRPASEVHFHEVGAVDSLVDIVAASACIAWLAPDRVVFSPLREGRGTIDCAHGVLPVPAPATLAILAARGIPVAFTDTIGEMVTPTGAGLAAALGDAFGLPCPSGRVLAVGYGAGQRDFAHPNLLRATLVETETETETEGACSGDAQVNQVDRADRADRATRDTVCVLEATMDDCDGESLHDAMEILREKGFPECYLTPAVMKKGRPGVVFTLLCPPGREDEAVALIFRHTTTIGLRRSLTERRIMPRETVTARTPYGEVPVKVSRWGDDLIRAKPEGDIVRGMARQARVPADVIRGAALSAWAVAVAEQQQQQQKEEEEARRKADEDEKEAIQA